MMSAMISPTPRITSVANPRVRAAVGLRDRRTREAAGLTIVDGAREVRRALDAGVMVVDAFVCESELAGPDARTALDRLVGLDAPRISVSEAVFSKLAFGGRTEGLVLVVRTPGNALADLAVGPDPLLFVVEGLSIREIADILAIPEATVKTRIFRAKAQLRDQLNPSGGVHALA